VRGRKPRVIQGNAETQIAFFSFSNWDLRNFKFEEHQLWLSRK
jgi:hypothetical protein